MESSLLGDEEGVGRGEAAYSDGAFPVSARSTGGKGLLSLERPPPLADLEPRGPTPPPPGVLTVRAAKARIPRRNRSVKSTSAFVQDRESCTVPAIVLTPPPHNPAH